MASVQFVTSNQVIQINNIPHFECPVTKNINCENTVIEGVWWAVPTIQGGIQSGWSFEKVSTAPSVDSVKVLRVYDKKALTTYWLALDPSTGSENDFIDRCNACCGTTPVMPDVTISPVLVEECPCADADGNYIYVWPLPYNPNTLNISIEGSSFNGVAGTPAPAAGGYATPAALLTFLNTAVTGWDAYGTWTLENANTLVKLVSSTVQCAAVDFGLIAESYCFEIPGASTEVNGIKIGGEITTFPNIFFSDSTESTRQAIIDAIRPFLIGDLEIVEDGGDYFVKYTGFAVPDNLTLDGADVAGTTFSTGACP